MRTIGKLQHPRKIALGTCLVWAAIPAVLFFGQSSAQDSSPDFQAIYRQYVTASNQKEPNDIVNQIHTQSPFYLFTIQQLQQASPLFDIQLSLDEFQYLGSDDIYSYAAATQTFQKLSGPAYQNTKNRIVIAFREEEGKWRIWTIASVEIVPIQ